jgi:hypothetical protein
VTALAWCLAAALHFAPPEKLVGTPYGDETVDAGRERYASICADIVGEVEARKLGRDHVALLLALGIGESGLARDADLGIDGNCYQGKSGRLGRCDMGKDGQARSASVWQVRGSVVSDEAGPVTVARLFADRKLAARHALRRAVSSLKTCTKGPPEDRLSALASGVCGVGEYPGRKSVRARWALYQKIRGWRP